MSLQDKHGCNGAAPKGTERCLCAIRDVVAAGSGGLVGWGDVLLTKEALHFVTYLGREAQATRGEDLKYALGGLLVGGASGAIIGGLIDEVVASSRKDRTIGRIKEKVSRLRSEDFGLGALQRIEKRGGLQIERSSLSGAKYDRTNRSMVLIQASGELTLHWQQSTVGGGVTSSISVSDALDLWATGRLEVRPETEGANVGVCLESFVATLCSGGGDVCDSVSDSAVQSMVLDRQYVAELVERLRRMPKRQREAALRSLHSRFPGVWSASVSWLTQRAQSRSRLYQAILGAAALFAVDACGWGPWIALAVGCGTYFCAGPALRRALRSRATRMTDSVPSIACSGSEGAPKGNDRIS